MLPNGFNPSVLHQTLTQHQPIRFSALTSTNPYNKTLNRHTASMHTCFSHLSIRPFPVFLRHDVRKFLLAT